MSSPNHKTENCRLTTAGSVSKPFGCAHALAQPGPSARTRHCIRVPIGTYSTK
ncbi:MAG: hypothetical protein AAGI08_06950 [Bacteroidota bacterium]